MWIGESDGPLSVRSFAYTGVLSSHRAGDILPVVKLDFDEEHERAGSVNLCEVDRQLRVAIGFRFRFLLDT
jgi:hypothetical protein